MYFIHISVYLNMRVALVICTISAIVALASARFHVYPKKLSYDEAYRYCQSRNMQLALPLNESETAELRSLINAIKPEGGQTRVTLAWLGAVQAFVNYKRQLVDVSSFVKYPTSKCVVAVSVRTMGIVPSYPISCDNRHYVICESKRD